MKLYAHLWKAGAPVNNRWTLRTVDDATGEVVPIATLSQYALDEHLQATAEGIASAVTACHGLDLPFDIAPGALTALVTAARSLLSAAEDTAGDVPGASADLAAALAPFTPQS